MKCKKITIGFVVQDYDGKNCVSQEFIAGDQVDYEDKDGNPVEVDTLQEEYIGFDMVQPPTTNSKSGLIFTCPECGKNRLECCEDGPYCSVITTLDEEGDFDYGPIDTSGEVERYQCVDCGYVLNDLNNFPITDNEEVVEWIKDNCEQSEGVYWSSRH